MKTRQIFSIREYLGTSLIPYNIISETDTEYILRDTSCSHYPPCEIIVNKDTMAFVKMNNEDAEYTNIYSENHKVSIFYKSEKEARVAFYNKVIDRYQQDKERVMERLAIANKLKEIIGKKKRVESEFDFRHYATKLFIPKDTNKLYELVRKTVFENGEIMELKDIKKQLSDSIVELEINKIIETKMQFRGNTSHTIEYYVDNRVSEYDENESSIYMKIYNKDKSVKFERMTFGEYGYDNNYYEKEYCKEISGEAGCVVFNTRANAVNFLLNLMLEKIDTIIKNHNNDITRYDKRIIETNEKINAWL